MNTLVKKSLFYFLKLPGMYLLIILGFIFDFLIQLPFRAMLAAERPPDKHDPEDSS